MNDTVMGLVYHGSFDNSIKSWDTVTCGALTTIGAGA